MLRPSLLLLLCLTFLPRLLADTAPSLAGTWKIDLARSTELSPWKDYELTLQVGKGSVTVARKLAWGRRVYEDTSTFPTTGKPKVLPFNFWPDNRHLGANVGTDKTRRVASHWLDDGRLLRVTSDFVLNTQQGDRAINVLSDYKVSGNGTELTLTELRSTRNRPVVYVFKRVTSTESK